ncbi:hypothetical protein GCK72_013017 [Caenorhabditis remanei]|uniref:Homeobox domain-containing protein n=1 Tax=Caenorhabditis remanei TaxID=31234 RepID=A0A6A5GPI2_CAERE|nr:hypothetical protein GCK72_013017 [Caenorhabditis remanei]KAF1756564.1 hypothetical protein GCK72_013017 [Caenorhabditis remanei]
MNNWLNLSEEDKREIMKLDLRSGGQSHQKTQLEAYFELNQNPTLEEEEEIALRRQLDHSKTATYFENARKRFLK